MFHADIGNAPLAGDIAERGTTAATAAGGAIARAGHLAPLDAQPVEYGAGCVELAIVTAEIAGVVIGDAAAQRLRRRDPATGEKLGEQRAVMHHLIAAAKCGILVLQA